MKVENVRPNLIAGHSVWINQKDKHRFALIEFKYSSFAALVFNSKRQDGLALSESLELSIRNYAALTADIKQQDQEEIGNGSLVGRDLTVHFFNDAPALTSISLIMLDQNYDLNAYETMKKCLDVIRIQLNDQVVGSNSVIYIDFMAKRWSFRVIEMRTIEDNDVNGIKIGKFDYKTEITTAEKTRGLEPLNVADLTIKSLQRGSINLYQQIKLFMDLVSKGTPQSLGYLLHGAPGVGKTTIAKRVARQSGLFYHYESAAKLLRPVQGECELSLVKLFDQMSNLGPSILILDEFDSLVESGSSFVPALFVELLRSTHQKPVFLIAITSRINTIPSSMFSSSCFSSRLEVTLPDFADRISSLKRLFNDLYDMNDTFLETIASETLGFSCLDMENLLRTVILKQSTETVSEQLILDCARITKPVNLAGYVSKIPNVYFKDLYGIPAIIETLKSMVIDPFSSIHKYDNFGVKPPKGIVIHGPSGVGKTSLACALANESGMACIYVSSASIRSKIVGKAEETISRLFAQAKSSAPCVLLMDQFEMLMSTRGSNSTSTNSGDRIVTTFLTEMDGIFSTASQLNVFIIAVTGNMNAIDPAILRPGRLDLKIHLPKPDFEARVDIFERTLAGMPSKLTGAEIKEIASSTDGYTSGEVVDLCREAAMTSLRQDLDFVTILQFKHQPT